MTAASQPSAMPDVRVLVAIAGAMLGSFMALEHFLIRWNHLMTRKMRLTNNLERAI